MVSLTKAFFATLILCIPIHLFAQDIFEKIYATAWDDSPAGAIAIQDGYIIGVHHSVHPELTVVHEAKLLKIDHAGIIQDSLTLAAPNSLVLISDMLSYSNEITLITQNFDTLTNIQQVGWVRIDDELNIINSGFLGDPLLSQIATATKVNQAGNFIILGNYYSNGSSDSLFVWEVNSSMSTVKSSSIELLSPPSSSDIVENISADNYTLLFPNILLEIDRSTLTLQSQHIINGNFFSLGYGRTFTDSTFIRFGSSIRDGSTMDNPTDWEMTAYEVSANTYTTIDTIICGQPDVSDFSSSKGFDFIHSDSLFFAGMENYYMPTPSLFQSQFWGVELWCVSGDGAAYWHVQTGNDALYWVHEVLATPDGGALVLGSKWDWTNNSAEERDLYLLKVDADGNFVTGIENTTDNKNGAVLYPNPSAAFSKINIREEGKTNIRIVDLQGNEMLQKTVNAPATVELALSNYSAGLYFIHLTNQNKSEVLKLIVVD